MEEISAQIKRLRQAKELSQKELAEACGMKQSVISRLEQSDYKNCMLETLNRIGNILGFEVGIIDVWQPIETAPRDGTEILCAWTLPDSATGEEVWMDEYAVLAFYPDWHGKGMGAWVLDGDFQVRYEPCEHRASPPTEFCEPRYWKRIHRNNQKFATLQRGLTHD